MIKLSTLEMVAQLLIAAQREKCTGCMLKDVELCDGDGGIVITEMDIVSSFSGEGPDVLYTKWVAPDLKAPIYRWYDNTTPSTDPHVMFAGLELTDEQ